MKSLSLFSLFLIPVFALTGCVSVSLTTQPTQSASAPTIATSILTPAIADTEPSTPTRIVRLPSDTPSPTITLTPPNTLEPAQITGTLQPLLKEPMNCDVPCFWGIIPGKTSFDEARSFFSELGFTPYEGIDRNSPSSGWYFYTISFDSGSGNPSRVTLFAFENLVEGIVVDPDIPMPKEGSPREWIAYSPETVIKRYGSPSSVRFTVSSYGSPDLPQNIGMNMIMDFESDLMVFYSGYNMTPESFCPLTAPFDFVQLRMGSIPQLISSSDTVPLEKATSLTIEEFVKLMTGDPAKACFTVKREALP